MKKTRSKKSRDTVPLKLSYIPMYSMHCIVSKVQKALLAFKGKVSHNLYMNTTMMNRTL
jgi:hypothetical protein